MYQYPEPLERLMEELMRLPTVGPKTAQRLAFHLLHAPMAEVEALSRAMLEVKERLRPCSRCGNLTDAEQCAICLDPRRDGRLLCVVAEPRDVAAFERTREFRGLYHILGGLLSPLDGVGPEQLAVGTLLQRLEREPIEELILATNPTVAGEATALYLRRQLEGRGLRITRLALGLPMGTDLDYADEVTLARALAGRQEM
ncbi:MAG TPA: recombination mediator RecR [Candidatus Nitrosotenuis sp.]|nr:recombination mediator RecR [Candidatus Nitrosotenuis sp.]